jgi:hypothetical protein
MKCLSGRKRCTSNSRRDEYLRISGSMNGRSSSRNFDGL